MQSEQLDGSLTSTERVGIWPFASAESFGVSWLVEGVDFEDAGGIFGAVKDEERAACFQRVVDFLFSTQYNLV